MASNDGQRLTIFGLSYRQHDNRSMQRILREYGRLPENPGERVGLFVALTALAKDLDEEETEGIKNWLQNGGEFPTPSMASPVHEFGRRPNGIPNTPELSDTAHPGIFQTGFSPFNTSDAARSAGDARSDFRGMANNPAYERPDFGDMANPPPRMPFDPQRYPIGRGFQRGRGRARPYPMPMARPGTSVGASSPAFGFGSGSRAFVGVGRSVVDNPALVPEPFPLANSPMNNISSTSGPHLLTGKDRGPRVDSGHTMGSVALPEYQRRHLRLDIDEDNDADEMSTEDSKAAIQENEATSEAWEDDWESEDQEEDPENENTDGDEDTEMEGQLDLLAAQADPLGRLPQSSGIFLPAINPHPPAPEGYLECCVCAEALPPTHFPASPNITSTCKHEVDSLVCLTCIEQAIRAPIDEGILNLVTCPLCPEKLSSQEIKLYASERIYARYQYLLMSLNPDMVFCLGRNCGSAQHHSPQALGPVMTCGKCSFRTCIVHKLPWHDGMTCEEFDCDESQIERLEQDEATAKLLASLSAKICPTCKQGVDRTDGCDHLRCRCGGEWCFECLASWENILRIGMTAHAPTCKSHPRRIQIRPDQKLANQARIFASVHGSMPSDAVQQARYQRDAKVRATIRPQALEAAERRAREAALAREAQEQTSNSHKKPKRTKLIAPWEEK